MDESMFDNIYNEKIEEMEENDNENLLDYNENIDAEMMDEQSGELTEEKDDDETSGRIEPLEIIDESSESYEINGYQYIKNDDNQILYAGGDLRLEEGERNSYAQSIAGGAFRHELDDGGHLIGTRFGGTGGVENLVAEDRYINRGAFKGLENTWAYELEQGNEVHVDIEPVYHGESQRPDIIMGSFDISNGENMTREYFSITNENLQSEEFAIDSEYDDKTEFPNALNYNPLEYQQELNEKVNKKNFYSMGEN